MFNRVNMESPRLQAPKGTQDFLPEQTRRWQAVEAIAREVAALYGFEEIRTPIFEDTALFHRGVGETTDIVTKETYTFETRPGPSGKGRSLTLRPEGTAPVVRALLEAGRLDQPQAVEKVYYLAAPMLRFERPQKGRYHQHHQFGIEAFGVAAPEQDVECMLLQHDLYTRCGLRDLTLHLNSLGDTQSKTKYAAALREFFEKRAGQLSEESRRRLEANPLRILDSKDPRDVAAREGAPANVDFLSEHSRGHFQRVCDLLEDAGVAFARSTSLVRGLDYYTETLWEFTAGGLGSQDAIGGGGRYDNLVETLGGKSVPGVGFGSGMERLLMALEAQGVSLPETYKRPVWVVAQSQGARDEALRLLRSLRRAGIAADMDYTGRSVKAQFKLADRARATHCLILGDDELAGGSVSVKDLETGEQRQVQRSQAIELFTPHDGGPH